MTSLQARSRYPFLPSRSFQDWREATETREATEQKHQQLEKALQDAEIRAQKEHRSWHRERQRCEKLEQEMKISSSEAAEATAKVGGTDTGGFTIKDEGFHYTMIYKNYRIRSNMLCRIRRKNRKCL